MLSLYQCLFNSSFEYWDKIPVWVRHKAVNDMRSYVFSLRIAGPDAEGGLTVRQEDEEVSPGIS